MEYSDSERRQIRSLAQEWNQRDFEYVILRGYEDLPEAVPGSDLDCFVSEVDFDAALAVCRDIGLTVPEPPGTNVRSLVEEGAQNPMKTLPFLFNRPVDAASYVRRTLFSGGSERRGFRERHMVDGALNVHLVNHLTYRSPMNGQQIRVDPEVESAMLDRREKHGRYAIPAPPDELAHLVCRGIFDYEGEFPDNYKRRCDRLVEEIRSDATANEQFRTLLSLLFFDADEVVYEGLLAGNYDDIRRSLRRFDDY